MEVLDNGGLAAQLSAPAALERSALAQRILGEGGRVARVTTVTAPPGYGKTTLLKQLVTAAARLPEPDRPCVLYTSASACEGHVGLFVAQLEAAARVALPEVDVTSLVQLRNTVQASEFARRLPFVLQRTIAECHTGPTLLLIDDLEELRSGEPLANIISGFIEAGLASLNFVFASQTSVPWDVGRLDGHHVALTSRELEFRREEIGRWLKQVSGRQPRPKVVAALHDRTGGWPGVVALSAMLLRHSNEETDGAIEELFERDGAEIVASIVDRLLETLEPTARYVLRTLSVVEVFTVEQAHELFRNSKDQLHSGAKFIDLPQKEVDRALATLRAAHLIAPVGGEALELHKMVQEALQERFEADVPGQAREAHRRTATFLLSHSDDSELPVAALEHLASAQDYERLLGVLEDRAERFFSAGYHRHLSEWLLALESYYTELPFWANLYLGRVYSQLGEWDRARAYFDRCKSELGDRERAGDMWRWQPRVCMGYAAMYWRRGMHSDASTYCRRGLDYIRRLEARLPWIGEVDEATSEAQTAELSEMKLSLLRLLGTLRLDAGATDLARDVFEEAEREATEKGMTRQRAQALKSLGRLATMRGDIADGAALYEEALSLIEADRDVQEYAEIAQELGTSRLMTGDPASAEKMLRGALDIHLSTAHPASIARAWTSLARCYAMNERMELADHAHGEAMRLLETVGNLRIRAEILDRYAIFLAHLGRTYEAKSVHERASTLISGMLRPEAPLLALHCEATVELYAAQQRDEEALALVTDAVDRYQRLGARFDVARLYWRAAALHHQLFVEDKRETPESVVSYLELAATIANQRKYAFSRMLVGPELVAVGVRFGLPETQEFSERAAAAIARDGGICELPEDSFTRYERFQRRLERADDFVLTSRDGRVGASDDAVAAAIDEHKDDSLVVALADHQMWNYGAAISLGQKRVILPLLVHFLRHADHVFSMAELAEKVWDAPELDDTTKTKVKVAISRLRGLLGKGRTYIVTGRRSPPTGRSVVTYGLHPAIRFLLVEPASDALNS